MRSDRRSGRVESTGQSSPEIRRSRLNKAPDYSRSFQSGRRLSQRRLGELAGELSERDRLVLAALAAVRVLSGGQLERLAFAKVTAPARGRIRRRVLARLMERGLVVTLERRVGGVRAGSAGLVYSLSGGGQRLLDLEAGRSAERRRSAPTPGALFLAHALAVAEVFVSLTEASRRVDGLVLRDFAVEADARFAGGERNGDVVLRPDALVVLARGAIEDVWWLEVDRGTESRPRLLRMLQRYLAFTERGVAGPRGVIPRVLVSVTDDQRRRAVRSLVRRLPKPAAALFLVCREAETAATLVNELVADSAREPP